MAKRKRKRKSTRCQIVTIRGKRRRICRSAKGRITSNTKVGGGKRKKRRKKKR